MNHLLHVAGKAYLVEARLFKLPFLSGLDLLSLRWLSSTAATSASKGTKDAASNLEATEHVAAFQSASGDRFDVEPLPRTNASRDAAKSASAGKSAKQMGILRMAYRDRLGIEPSSIAYKRFAKGGTKDDVSEKLDAWIATFGRESTRKILRKGGHLLTQDPVVMKARLADVCNLYGWSETDGIRAVCGCPTIVVCTVKRQTAWIKQVAVILGVSESQVAKLILTAPNLVNLGTNNIAAKMSSLRSAFSAVDAVIIQLIMKFPVMLVLKSESLASKVSNIKSELSSLVPYDARQVISAHPTLLGLSPATMKDKIRALKSACLKDPEWMKALQSLKPISLGGCLIYKKEAFNRLEFYQESARAAKLSFSTLLRMHDDVFNASYPDYEEWCHKQHSKEREAGNQDT